MSFIFIVRNLQIKRKSGRFRNTGEGMRFGNGKIMGILWYHLEKRHNVNVFSVCLV